MSAAALGTLAAYGAISYEGTTFTQSKRCKVITSGLINIAYGIVVIILAYLLKESLIFTISSSFEKYKGSLRDSNFSSTLILNSYNNGIKIINTIVKIKIYFNK